MNCDCVAHAHLGGYGRQNRENDAFAVRACLTEILDAKEVLGAGRVPAVTLEGIESADAPLVIHEKPSKKYGS
jgi:hypothetical protein